MTLLAPAALLVSALGVVAALLGAASAGDPRAGLWMMLDLWMAAGLLRLASAPTWSSIGGVAALILVRKLVVFTLSRAGRRRAARADLPT